MNSRMEILTYLENNDRCPEKRSVDEAMRALRIWYGGTDSARVWSWLSSFAEFKRGNGGAILRIFGLGATGAPRA